MKKVLVAITLILFATAVVSQAPPVPGESTEADAQDTPPMPGEDTEEETEEGAEETQNKSTDVESRNNDEAESDQTGGVVSLIVAVFNNLL